MTLLFLSLSLSLSHSHTNIRLLLRHLNVFTELHRVSCGLSRHKVKINDTVIFAPNITYSTSKYHQVKK